ncbi:hypothetical protein K469DRAFT_745905 [Zopfia rhizophila CBS 207.26]|uniref:Uncharacterized protein n=1 Tax=Zopfia rhizophila CBS 207.26 TaxID=1314779 RepID=A0A6A6EN43_9PEZI|nr:hypothetical protein K469DRAFT_745905 [Zopfia rhizophila CBS 207.26]
MTTSQNTEHTFIFHDDDEERPSWVQRNEVAVAGHVERKHGYPANAIHDATPDETQIIQLRSARLKICIDRGPTSTTHLWPDLDHGIQRSGLVWVIRHLAGRAPILQDWKRLKSLENAEWLTIIAFVLGPSLNDILRAQLAKLVWSSSSELTCVIPYLQQWIQRRRMETLERVYTIFQEHVGELRSTHGKSKIASNIISKLNDPSGVNIDFSLGWRTQCDNGGKVVGMSPKALADDILQVLLDESGIPPVNRSASLLSNGSDHYATPKPYGPRQGAGGDFWEFTKTVIGNLSSSHAEDKVITEIHTVVKKAQDLKNSKWKRLESDKIKTLVEWRDAQQSQWRCKFIGPDQMNGNTISPSNA